jgi:hypothetical protein
MVTKPRKPTKYTAEFVENELLNMLEEIKADREIVLMGQLFENRDYSPQRFSEWREKFKDNKRISESLRKIKSILETRINLRGLKGEFNATMTKLNLTNNYGWRDRIENEVTGRDGGPIETKWEIIVHDADAPA